MHTSSSTAPRPSLLPLAAVSLAGAAVGYVLRGERGRPIGSRGGLALLLGAAALALISSRRRAHGRAEAPPVTQAVVPTSPADTPMGVPGRSAEERLDEAVQETFPASDPIAVHIE